MITFPRFVPGCSYYRFGTRDKHWAFCPDDSSQYIKENPQSLTLSMYPFKGSTRVEKRNCFEFYIEDKLLPFLVFRNIENWEFYFPGAKALYFRFDY